MGRVEERQRKRKTNSRRNFYAFCCVILVLLVCLVIVFFFNDEDAKQTKGSSTDTKNQTAGSSNKTNGNKEKKITIMASGDMLYHDIVYGSAYDGEKYDFDNDYEQIKPLVSSADLALGDFEGTINPNRELAGYPIFNTPEEVIKSIKDAGYDALDLAHNHILDTGIEGLVYTAKAFQKQGIDTFGVNVPDDSILVKNVNGIKVAILGYSYGFNGIEESISQTDYDKYLNDLNLKNVESDIKQAEKIADITVIMPQLGEEYRLDPTDEQKEIYHKMIDWGADIIFGGHPHVAEPTEIVKKDEQNKFIIYSMGNLLSNQRFETLENYWTERGVIMEVEVTQKNNTTKISNIIAHPTWVSREPIDRQFMGYPAYDYQVFLAEDYLPGGKYAKSVAEDKRLRIETAYNEMIDLLDIKW